jgi:type IV pilus assembly protein PilX
MKTSLKNERGIALVVALIILAVIVLAGAIAIMTSTTDLNISANYKAGNEALYVAEAGLERAKAYLKTVTDMDSVLTTNGGMPFGLTPVSFGGGAYSVVVTNNTGDAGGASHDSDNTVVVTSTGTSAGSGKRVIEAVFIKPTITTPGIRGAVTANYNVGTLGTMTVDGRDHDINGNLISPATGLLGVSTRGAITEGGNSMIGGMTPGGTDVAPTKTGTFGPPATGWASACEQNATWTAPTTPDAALGWPAGTLKKIAQSGAAGSRYVTDPASLTLPLSGVTYVELASGTSWDSADFGNSTGILIVHNSDTNAMMTNTNAGTFKGVIIVDDLVHVHNNIIGAAINLTSNPSAGNCIGNGTGNILYSQTAVANALNAVSQWTMASWREVY